MLSRAVRGRGIARHGVAALRGVATTGDDRSPSDVHASGHRDAAERGDADASTSSSSSRSSSRSSSSRSSSSSAPPADFATSSSTSSSSSSRELYPGHVQLTPLQRAMLVVGGGLGAILFPQRADLVGAVGETTGHLAFRRMRDRMRRDAVGADILRRRPRVTDDTLERAWGCADGTFGKAYATFMGTRKFRASDRPPVRFVDDEELAYVATRARETHDLWHVLFGCPTTVQGELALKALEFAQTGMPSAALATLAAPLRLGTFYLTLVPIRPRPRGERRSLRNFPGASLRPSLAFNPRPRRLSTPPDAFQLHPDVRSCGPLTLRRGGPRVPREGAVSVGVARGREVRGSDVRGLRGGVRYGFGGAEGEVEDHPGAEGAEAKAAEDISVTNDGRALVVVAA
jgi:ubiquinone biosynthesis protein COQ4